jgi:hypothetical protein
VGPETAETVELVTEDTSDSAGVSENIEVELFEDWSGAAPSPAAASTKYGSSLRFL